MAYNQNAPAVFNFSLLHEGDSFIPGEEFKIDPASLGVSDADGTSQLGAGTWAWYRHDASSVDASSEVHAISGASFTNYFASDEDVGYYVSLKFQFTDGLSGASSPLSVRETQTLDPMEQQTSPFPTLNQGLSQTAWESTRKS